LIERNRRKFPHAIFWEIGTDPKDPYDLVCSLYTIEHVVRPVEYLELLWSYCRSGGIIGIICPDYIDGDGIPLSVYFGSSALRIREKVMRGRFWDLACHLYEWKVLAPKWKQKAREMKSGAFWMNLDPSDLAGHPHRIDGDAVHFRVYPIWCSGLKIREPRYWRLHSPFRMLILLQDISTLCIFWHAKPWFSRCRMLFNSIDFVIFFLLVLGLYYCLAQRSQNLLLLIASNIFYGWWDWRFSGLDLDFDHHRLLCGPRHRSLE
jgi:hypothetical protein